MTDWFNALSPPDRMALGKMNPEELNSNWPLSIFSVLAALSSRFQDKYSRT